MAVYGDKPMTARRQRINDDVTVRARDQETLRGREERYRELFEHSPIGIWEEDYSAVRRMIDWLRNQGVRDFPRYFREHPETLRQAVAAIKLLDVNQATLKIYRAPNKEDFLRAVTDPARQPIRESFYEEQLSALAEGESRVVVERCDRAFDGSDIVIRAITHIVDTDKESWSRVVSTVEDITERVRAQEALAQKARQLERSNAELEQFASIASHELQEPLRMVASYCELLQRRYKGKLDADADEFIGYAMDGAMRMRALIDDLLRYARVRTRGKELESTDSEAVLDLALANLQLAISQSGAVVTHDALPTVEADGAQLVQLFQNLIGNAIKFRGEDPPHVHVSAEKKVRKWVFSVADNGIGVDPKDTHRIFALFQRLRSKREYPGTGIGLAMCKKIVERHGGRIWVESEPGQGSTFRFTLPISKDKQ